ncbi:hypothetical protein [Labilibaculum euxinus]
MDYPIIKYPNYHEIALKSEIPIPEPPKEPGKPILESGNMGCFSLIGIIIGVFLAIKTGEVFLFISPFALFLLIDFAVMSGNKNKAQIDYEQKLNRYNIELSKYNKELTEYNILVQDTRNKYDTIRHRQIILRNFIKERTSRPTNKRVNQNQGASELFFKQYLLSSFPYLIITDHILGEFNCSEPYIPDFILQDNKTNLHIDIEIDEPYSLKSKRPIHYIENNKHIDNLRDSYFNKAGWYVVRFTEEQVLKYPKKCCGVIAQLLADTIGVKYPTLQEKLLMNTPCWTKSKAIELRSINYREKYLNAHQKEKEDFIENYYKNLEERRRS